MKRLGEICGLLFVTAAPAFAQSPAFLSNLQATRTSPIYTTYAAAYERSSFTLDEGYHFRFYAADKPIAYTTDNAGEWSLAFRFGDRWVRAVRELAREPVITTSYGNIVRYSFRPASDLEVAATFLVYSSRIAITELRFTNRGKQPISFDAVMQLHGDFHDIVAPGDGSLRFRHSEPPDRWVVDHGQPHVANVQNVMLFTGAANVQYLSAQQRHTLAPGAQAVWRAARVVAPADSANTGVVARARALLSEPLEPFVTANEELYAAIPAPKTQDPRRQILYWNAFTLLRQVMLPPEGATRHPYYVFSREPQWGWGHGGQVFHESLSMLAYAHMDPAGAMRSQRVYVERQHADGYIPYRVGPYLEETIVHQGERTTSAPWYAWQNWEIYRITRDTAFLSDLYSSSKRFYQWIERNRDRDRDGLFEWGAHGVLESVRDGDVAVWDQVGWPSNFEALDLNAMMVAEANALAHMANELGSSGEALEWTRKAEALKQRIENTFWDETTGFYYHVDHVAGGFTHKTPNDLKRREIIGLLPLWAGIASPDRARRLINTLTDTTAFWRRYGVPSLAADDAYYNPRGYWNGPVWVEWNYLIARGLRDYGYVGLAAELTDRVAEGMTQQLEKTHVFWEMYSPDGDWAGHHHAYIWAGLIARMILDAE